MNGEEIGNASTSSSFDPYEMDEDEDELPDCLRARNETIPPSMYGKRSFPVINLGEISIFACQKQQPSCDTNLLHLLFLLRLVKRRQRIGLYVQGFPKWDRRK